MNKLSIQEFLSHYAAARKLSGTILIAIKDRIVAGESFGFADRAAGIHCDRDTQFLIGSVTKQFAAVAVLKMFYDMAIQRGLNKDDAELLEQDIREKLHKPIAHYLPKDLPIWSGNMPSWGNVVTPHQLLLHSSGIPNYTDLRELKEKFFTEPPNLQQLIETFKDKPLNFVSGTLFSYSNSGYILLQAMLEQLMQTSLSTYLDEIIFTPLQMRSTTLPSEGTVIDLKGAGKYLHLARGYEFDLTVPNPSMNEIKNYVPIEIARAAGGMISNAPDLLRWNNALYSGNVIPKFLLNFMLNSAIGTGAEGDSYAYGLESKISSQMGKYFFHRGGIDGYKSDVTYIPQLKMSLISLSNQAGGGEAMIMEIKNIVEKLPKTLTDKEKSDHVDSIIKSKYPYVEKNKDLYDDTFFVGPFLKELEANKIEIS